MAEKLIQPFGYTEMYEWTKTPTNQRFGLFVQFSKRYPDRIEPCHSEDGVLAGVSSICSAVELIIFSTLLLRTFKLSLISYISSSIEFLISSTSLNLDLRYSSNPLYAGAIRSPVERYDLLYIAKFLSSQFSIKLKRILEKYSFLI